MPIETLDTTGFFFEEVGFKAARLSANYGDGYTAGARIGSTQGLKGWRVRIDALPDQTRHGTISSMTRARYLFDFWRRHKLELASEIFRMKDRSLPRDAEEPYVFARFGEEEMSWQQFCETVFSTGLVIREARIAGEDPNA